MKTTKKLLCLLLALTFVFLSACTESEKSEGSKAESSVAESKDEESEVSQENTSEIESSENSENVSETESSEVTTTPLTFADCETRVERTNGYSIKSDFYQKALNSQYFAEANANATEDTDDFAMHLPIYKIESVEDVDRVQEILNEPNSENLTFKMVMGRTDEDFFKTTTVFLTYFLSGTGSYEYLVTDVDENGTVTVAQKEYPENWGVTADEAGWLFFVFAPKEKADKLATVDAVYDFEEYIEDKISFTYSFVPLGYYMNDDCYTTDENGNTITDMHLTQFYKDTINKDKLPKRPYYPGAKESLPTFKFESKAELEAFKEKYKDCLNFDRSVSIGTNFSDFMQSIEQLDFENNTVFMIYVTDSVCDSKFTVENVVNENGFALAYVKQTEKGFSEAMGGWGLFVTVPNSELNGISAFDAKIERMKW